MNDLAAFVAGLILGSIAFFIVGGKIAETQYQRHAIQRGFAQYNPTNGVFEWKGKE